MHLIANDEDHVDFNYSVSVNMQAIQFILVSGYFRRGDKVQNFHF